MFEVDCGDGAFLVPLHLNGYIVGGIDADAGAIELAMASMPDGLFQVGTASELDPAVPWDIVVCRSLSGSSSVALAKEAAADLDYIRGLLARMFAKATHAIALLDVPEARQQWIFHALTEIGASAIQFETTPSGDVHVFARV